MGGAIRVGVGGWTYEPWRGAFYPPGLPQARELAYMAEHVTAIEINATFYGRQKPASFAAWAKAAPEGFRFAVKGSRYCTNRRVLAEAGESIGRFVEQGIVELGDKLGPILWQFAATKAFDADDMAAFVALLPAAHAGVPLARVLEPRHPSFDCPAFVALARGAGVAIAYADHPTYPAIDAATAPFAYARLQRAAEDCPTGYDDAALDAWAARARDWAARGDAYVFLISGAKVRNPAGAVALIERLRA